MTACWIGKSQGGGLGAPYEGGPYRLNLTEKELFLDRMYEALKTKISREQFNLDVKLATLNEYIEFVEAEEDEDGWYLEHAQALAEELLNL